MGSVTSKLVATGVLTTCNYTERKPAKYVSVKDEMEGYLGLQELVTMFCLLKKTKTKKTN